MNINFQKILTLIITISFLGHAAAQEEKAIGINDLMLASLPSLTLKQQELVINEVMTQDLLQKALEPIYIGGARYKLNISDFTRVRIPRNQIQFYYWINIPVYGDVGQELFFDVFGRTGDVQNLPISVSCGTYNDGEWGHEYVMSKSMYTDGSCNIFKVEFRRFGGDLNSNLELNVLISEQLN